MLQGYKTYIGLFVVLVSFIAAKFGYTVNAELLTAFIHASLNDVGIVSGLVIAFIGRLKAYKTFISKGP